MILSTKCNELYYCLTHSCVDVSASVYVCVCVMSVCVCALNNSSNKYNVIQLREREGVSMLINFKRHKTKSNKLKNSIFSF